MKKIIFVLTFFLLWSCQNVDGVSDGETPANTPMLVTKMTDSDGLALSFTYDGSKIVKIEAPKSGVDFYTVNFTYDGDNIKKIAVKFSVGGGLATADYTIDNIYTDGKLSKQMVSNIEDEYYETNTFTYTDATTVNVKKDITMGGETGVINSVYKLNSNGDISTITGTGTYMGENATENLITKYSTLNNPFKNITGFNKLIYMPIFMIVPGNSALTEHDYKQHFDMGSGFFDAEVYFKSSFTSSNSQNYPTKESRDFGDGDVSTITYQYNQ